MRAALRRSIGTACYCFQASRSILSKQYDARFLLARLAPGHSAGGPAHAKTQARIAMTLVKAELSNFIYFGRIISKRSRVLQYQCGEAMRPIVCSLSV